MRTNKQNTYYIYVLPSCTCTYIYVLYTRRAFQIYLYLTSKIQTQVGPQPMGNWSTLKQRGPRKRFKNMHLNARGFMLIFSNRLQSHLYTLYVYSKRYYIHSIKYTCGIHIPNFVTSYEKVFYMY